jgi:hypothetical protein
MQELDSCPADDRQQLLATALADPELVLRHAIGSRHFAGAHAALTE